MNAPATRRSRFLRPGLLLLTTIALWLVLIDWPGPVEDYLDASWQSALVIAHEEGRSFGNGIIFSAGPLGFLNAHFCLPGSLGTKLAWEFGGKLLLVVALVAFTSPLPPVRRAVFFATAALLINFQSDSFFMLLLVFAVWQWLLPPAISRWRAASALVLIAFLAQVKFTHCLLAFSGVALAVGARSLQRDWRGALGLGAGFVAACFAFWLLAGQNPVRIWDYLRYSWQISAGYPWAMSFDETWPVFFAGTAVALLCAACAWRLWRTATGPRLAALPLPLFLTAAWFLAWKHGFTRADGHVLGFFNFCALLGVALPALVAPASRRWWFEVVAPLCLLGFWLAEPAGLAGAPENVWARLRMSVHGFSHARQLSVHFAQEVAQQRARHDLPAWRKVIGQGTVDLINCEQGLLFLNDLNYHPRPIPQSYSVYTGPLIQKNAGFFRRPTAPEFVVVRLNPIDQRFPLQDDSLVMAELPLRYDVVFEDNESAIFQRKAVAPAAREITRTRLSEQGAVLGQEIRLPLPGNHPLWLQARFPLSWIGRLRSLLYKPPQLMMVVVDADGGENRHRIIPTIAPTGFVIQPLIQTAADYANFARGKGSKTTRSIRFEAAGPDETEFWSGGTVTLSELPELPLHPLNPMHAMVEAGISNLTPLSATSDTTVQFVGLPDQRNGLLVHAKGSLVFEPAPAHRRVDLEFCLTEGAYTNEGRTDGAEFLAECTLADGRTTIVWRQSLDPLHQPADRGLQRATLELPPGTTRVTLQTLAGPKANNLWDWTCWAKVTFSPDR